MDSPDMSSVLASQYTNISGLVLLVYDQIITWDKEVNRIWRSGDWVLKIMFFTGCYWALAFQIINLTVTHPYVLKKQMINCLKWFGFQSCAVGVLLVNLQLILILRVYALYERGNKMASFLACWFVFYISMMFLSTRKVIPSLKFDSSCMMVEAPDAGATISFGILCTLDQCILWGLTAYKYRGAIRCGLSTNPILRLVMRDTSWTCLAICCLFIATVPSTLVKQFMPFHSLLSSLVSVLTCRTILNLRGLSSSENPLSIDVATVDFELTDHHPE